MELTKKHWGDITVDEWVELSQLREEDLSFYEYQLSKLSILTESLVDDEYWDNLDIDDINMYIKQASFIDLEPTKNFKNVIGDYRLIQFNKITLGEWIDIDSYLTSDFFNNFTKLLSILYRKTEIDKWGNVIYEPYDFDIKQRSFEFCDISITDVYGVIELVSDFRKNILEGYKVILMVDDGDELDDEEKEGLSEEDIIEIENDLAKDKIKKDFAWIKFVSDLTDGDITKTKDVLETNFIYILNNQMMLYVFKQN